MCAFCAFPIAELVLIGVKYMVIKQVKPGKTSLPVLNTLVGIYSRHATGGAYLGWFLAAAVVLFCTKVTVVLWALRRPAAPGFPVFWVILGAVGLLLRPVCGFLHAQLTASAGALSLEHLAHLVVASSVTGLLSQGLSWLMWGALLVYLAVTYQRRATP